MRVPEWLDTEAKKAWHRWKSKVHPDTDADTLALLCDLWSKWRATNPDEDSKQAIRYIALSKQIQSLGKQLGLFPDQKKQQPKIEDNDDEFRDL